MATLGATIISNVFGQTDAEKAFRPWWDNLEDFMIYGLVMLGLIITPTAIIMGTPLDCNYCQDDFCGKDYINTIPPLEGNYSKNPGFNAWWIKKYCTFNGTISDFMLYFPYLLLISGLMLVGIERFFVKMFKVGQKMDKFYNLLKQEQVFDQDDSDDVASSNFSDGGREALEVKHMFSDNDDYYVSYVLRTTLEILVAIGLLVWMCVRGIIDMAGYGHTVYCNVHDYWHECSGQPQGFYVNIFYISLVLLVLYVVANMFNILWLFCPCLGRLSRVMNLYRSKVLESDKSGKSEQQLLGNLLGIYFNNRDLKLLFDLLCAGSGVAPAISLICLFDEKFRKTFQPPKLATSVRASSTTVQSKPAADPVHAALAESLNLMYVAEVSSQSPNSGKVVLELVPTNDMDVAVVEKEDTFDYLEMGGRSAGVISATFTGLETGVDYNIAVSTVISGVTVSTVKMPNIVL